eukprot:2721557-Alexandrium_andersonii.AAC.1
MSPAKCFLSSRLRRVSRISLEIRAVAWPNLRARTGVSRCLAPAASVPRPRTTPSQHTLQSRSSRTMALDILADDATACVLS